MHIFIKREKKLGELKRSFLHWLKDVDLCCVLVLVFALRRHKQSATERKPKDVNCTSPLLPSLCFQLFFYCFEQIAGEKNSTYDMKQCLIVLQVMCCDELCCEVKWWRLACRVFKTQQQQQHVIKSCRLLFAACHQKGSMKMLQT